MPACSELSATNAGARSCSCVGSPMDIAVQCRVRIRRAPSYDTNVNYVKCSLLPHLHLPPTLRTNVSLAGLLPRIRTPDSAAPGGGRPSSSGGAAGSLPAMASYNAALPEVVSSGSSTAAGSLGSPVSRSPTASASRVAFREAPGGPASSKARTGSAMKKTSSIQPQGRPGGQ